MRLPLLLAFLALVFAGPAAGQDTARELVVSLPGPGGSTLAARVLRPPGEIRQPLVVINHGSPADGAQRAKMQLPRFATLSSWFLARGYVVALPLRRGYGETTSAWAEAYGSCNNPDYLGAGLQGAADIRTTIDFLRAQPYVAPDRTIVVGYSAGGWASIALSSQNPPGVAGLINFAGGRGGHQRQPGGTLGNCAPTALVDAAATYGATARLPMLWLYAENDSFFAPALAARMADAYKNRGGRVTYQTLPPFGREGHDLAWESDGTPVWAPLVEGFLATLK